MTSVATRSFARDDSSIASASEAQSSQCDRRGNATRPHVRHQFDHAIGRKIAVPQIDTKSHRAQLTRCFEQSAQHPHGNIVDRFKACILQHIERRRSPCPRGAGHQHHTPVGCYIISHLLCISSSLPSSKQRQQNEARRIVSGIGFGCPSRFGM